MIAHDGATEASGLQRRLADRRRGRSRGVPVLRESRGQSRTPGPSRDWLGQSAVRSRVTAIVAESEDGHILTSVEKLVNSGRHFTLANVSRCSCGNGGSRDRFSRANFCGEHGGRGCVDTRDRVRLLASCNRARVHGDKRSFPADRSRAPCVAVYRDEREEERKMVPEGLGSDIVAVS